MMRGEPARLSRSLQAEQYDSGRAEPASPPPSPLPTHSNRLEPSPTPDGHRGTLTRHPPNPPNELIHHILLLALPAPSFDQQGDLRNRTAATLMRVCRSWRWVEKELYVAPTLATWSQTTEFIQSLEAKGGKERAKLVRTLRLGKEWSAMEGDEEGDNFRVRELLQHCRDLETLFISKLEEVRLELSALQHGSSRVFLTNSSKSSDRTGIAGLRAFHICDSSFDPFPRVGRRPSNPDQPPGRLPNLQHLTLPYYSEYGMDLPHAFRRIATPALRAAHLDGSPGPFFPFAHLRYLACDLYFDRPPYSVVELPLVLYSCTAQHFRYPDAQASLPPSIRSLRLKAGHFFGSDVLTPYLSSSPSPLPQLEELILPMKISTSASFEALREWARENGVVIRWEKDEEGLGTLHDAPFWGAVERWEKKIEDEEQEAAAAAAVAADGS